MRHSQHCPARRETPGPINTGNKFLNVKAVYLILIYLLFYLRCFATERYRLGNFFGMTTRIDLDATSLISGLSLFS